MPLLGALSASLAALTGVVASIVNLERPGHFVHWHFLNISVANLVVIALMVVVFIAALVVPFPRHKERERSDGD